MSDYQVFLKVNRRQFRCHYETEWNTRDGSDH